ncbi:hypothetical protein BJ508DRAFT_374296 [Ascobolus immersus RN42]|uniref:Uncharacterized protein n=1 Tax=Ascobolus immersus RN42 TaxID=1160509 RepID=A0A3N4IJF3_ASCIM|nr:hypothetical protein BJ508DRAFT_374296 [Ascobolus immersus RN42]
MWAVCLVDHSFNRIATPLLYRSIVLSVIPTRLLLRTLLDRPDLGNYTLSLAAYDEARFIPSIRFQGESELNYEHNPYFAPEDLELGREMTILAGERFGMIKGWQDQCDDDADIARSSRQPWLWVFILFYYLPNLRHFELTPSDVFENALSITESVLNGWLNTDSHTLLAAPRCLSSITSVRRRACAYAWEFSNDRQSASKLIHPILCTPKLRHLTIDNAEFHDARTYSHWYTEHFDVEPELDPKNTAYFHILYTKNFMSNLEILEMHGSHFSRAGLRAVFERTPHLRVVKLGVADGQVNWSDDHFSRDADMNFSAAFALLRNTLEELEMYDGYSQTFITQMDNYGWVGDLSQFAKLRRLKLDDHFWTLPNDVKGSSADYLPDHLDYLQLLTDCGGVLYQGVYDKKVNGAKVSTRRGQPPDPYLILWDEEEEDDSEKDQQTEDEW